jgi:hypothetical protein
MKSWLVLGVALAATAAQEPASDKQPGSDPTSVPTNMSDKPVAGPSQPVAIRFELRDNLVAFETTINGQKQTAVLDSGAGALVLDRLFAERIGLNAKAAVGEVAGGGAQAQQLQPITVAKLTVGPLRFANIDGYAVNLEQLSASAGFPINILVGAPAFKSGAVTVDYQRRTVTFGPSGSARGCQSPISITIVHDVPVVEAELRPTADSEPVRLKLVVDLGTRDHAVLLGGRFFRSKAGETLLKSGVPQQVGHGTGGAVEGSVSRAAEMRIGKMSIADPEVALSSGVSAFEAGGFDGSLGVPLWKDGAITFDYQRNQICIRK